VAKESKAKEYESIKTIVIDGKKVDLITVLRYTPSDGGKGAIVKIREHPK